MKNRYLRLIALLFVILLTACNKYEDGPFFSIRSAESRVIGKWYLASLQENDEEILEFSQEEYEFDNDGSFLLYEDGEVYPGTWELIDKNETLRIGDSTDSSEFYDYKINRLTNTELWLEYTINSNVFEVRLKAK